MVPNRKSVFWPTIIVTGLLTTLVVLLVLLIDNSGEPQPEISSIGKRHAVLPPSQPSTKLRPTSDKAMPLHLSVRLFSKAGQVQQPLAGASLTIVRESSPEGQDRVRVAAVPSGVVHKSNAEGICLIPRIEPGRFRLSTHAPGLLNVQQVVKVDRAHQEATLVLPALGHLFGQVRTRSGAPIEGAHLRLLSSQRQSLIPSNAETSPPGLILQKLQETGLQRDKAQKLMLCTSDSEGTFEFPSVPPGLAFRIKAFHPEHGTVFKKEQPLLPGEMREVNFTLSSITALKGHLPPIDPPAPAQLTLYRIDSHSSIGEGIITLRGSLQFLWQDIIPGEKLVTFRRHTATGWEVGFKRALAIKERTVDMGLLAPSGGILNILVTLKEPTETPLTVNIHGVSAPKSDTTPVFPIDVIGKTGQPTVIDGVPAGILHLSAIIVNQVGNQYIFDYGYQFGRIKEQEFDGGFLPLRVTIAKSSIIEGNLDLTFRLPPGVQRKDFYPSVALVRKGHVFKGGQLQKGEPQITLGVDTAGVFDLIAYANGFICKVPNVITKDKTATPVLCENWERASSMIQGRIEDQTGKGLPGKTVMLGTSHEDVDSHGKPNGVTHTEIIAVTESGPDGSFSLPRKIPLVTDRIFVFPWEYMDAKRLPITGSSSFITLTIPSRK